MKDSKLINIIEAVEEMAENRNVSVLIVVTDSKTNGDGGHCILSAAHPEDAEAACIARAIVQQMLHKKETADFFIAVVQSYYLNLQELN